MKLPVWHWGEATAPLRAHLDRGGVLAIPTESSYGLAADPGNPVGVAAIHTVKGRLDPAEAGKALPVVVADRDQLALLGIDPHLAILERLAPVWPAALSVVVPVAATLPASGGEATLAVRIPGHPRLRQLLAVLGPLTATSANRGGEAPILDPRDLPALFAGAPEIPAIVVDDGILAGGPPSTLVAAAGARGEDLAVLRLGGFAAADLP